MRLNSEHTHANLARKEKAPADLPQTWPLSRLFQPRETAAPATQEVRALLSQVRQLTAEADVEKELIEKWEHGKVDQFRPNRSYEKLLMLRQQLTPRQLRFLEMQQLVLRKWLLHTRDHEHLDLGFYDRKLRLTIYSPIEVVRERLDFLREEYVANQEFEHLRIWGKWREFAAYCLSFDRAQTPFGKYLKYRWESDLDRKSALVDELNDELCDQEFYLAFGGESGRSSLSTGTWPNAENAVQSELLFLCREAEAAYQSHAQWTAEQFEGGTVRGVELLQKFIEHHMRSPLSEKDEDRLTTREIKSLKLHLENLDLVRGEVRRRNIKMLRAYCGPELLEPETRIFARSVLIEDQRLRVWIIGVSFALMIVSGLTVSLNSASMHGFYRERLQDYWLCDGGGFRGSITLPHLVRATEERGFPYLLIGTTANFSLKQDKARGTIEGFVFSGKYCGGELKEDAKDSSKSSGFARTELYSGRIDLAGALAISGAAVNPNIGQGLLVNIMLLILNLRLGQWVPNPRVDERGKHDYFYGLWRYPSPLVVLASLFRTRQKRPLYFLTDGGHTDNLGLRALVERRCRVIIVSDATEDPNYTFQDLQELLRRLRVNLGVEVVPYKPVDGAPDAANPADGAPVAPNPAEVGLKLLCPVSEDKRKEGDKNKAFAGFAKKSFVLLRIRYPDSTRKVTNRVPNGAQPGRQTGAKQEEAGPKEGWLIYVKPNLANDLPFDIEQYARQCTAFPQDASADQSFSPDRFEAYRCLGHHIGIKLGEHLNVTKERDTEDSLTLLLREHGQNRPPPRQRRGRR